VSKIRQVQNKKVIRQGGIKEVDSLHALDIEEERQNWVREPTPALMEETSFFGGDWNDVNLVSTSRIALSSFPISYSIFPLKFLRFHVII
jgi:hypothetical protein